LIAPAIVPLPWSGGLIHWASSTSTAPAGLLSAVAPARFCSATPSGDAEVSGPRPPTVASHDASRAGAIAVAPPLK